MNKIKTKSSSVENMNKIDKTLDGPKNKKGNKLLESEMEEGTLLST